MSGTDSKPIYLDANVILDWVGRNQDRAEATGVGGIIRAINKRELVAVTSQITRLEVLECKSEPTMWKAWERFQGLKNVTVAPINQRILDRACEIRNFYQAAREADAALKRAPTSPDAIHVATALIFGCGVLYTFDRGRTEKKTVSPTDMDGLVAGKYPLHVRAAEHAEPAFNL